MGLNNSQYDAIMREYDGKQSRNRREQKKRQERAYERLPRLKELDDLLSSLAVRQARRLLDGDTEAVKSLKEEYAAIRREKEELLSREGFAPDYLEMHYDCPLCKDTGFVEGRKCRCFLQKDL